MSPAPVITSVGDVSNVAVGEVAGSNLSSITHVNINGVETFGYYDDSVDRFYLYLPDGLASGVYDAHFFYNDGGGVEQVVTAAVTVVPPPPYAPPTITSITGAAPYQLATAHGTNLLNVERFAVIVGGVEKTESRGGGSDTAYNFWLDELAIGTYVVRAYFTNADTGVQSYVSATVTVTAPGAYPPYISGISAPSVINDQSISLYDLVVSGTGFTDDCVISLRWNSGTMSLPVTTEYHSGTELLARIPLYTLQARVYSVYVQNQAGQVSSFSSFTVTTPSGTGGTGSSGGGGGTGAGGSGGGGTGTGGTGGSTGGGGTGTGGSGGGGGVTPPVGGGTVDAGGPVYRPNLEQKPYFVDVTQSTWRNGRRMWLNLPGIVTNSSTVGSYNLYDGPGCVWLPGITGHLLPPYALSTRRLPGSDVSMFDSVQVGDREVFIPLRIEAPSYGELNTKRTKLIQSLGHLTWTSDDQSGIYGDSRYGQVTLFAESLSGGVRSLACLYNGGLEGNEGQDANGKFYFTFGLKLLALDPWWHDAEVNEYTFQLAVAATPVLGEIGARDLSVDDGQHFYTATNLQEGGQMVWANEYGTYRFSYAVSNGFAQVVIFRNQLPNGTYSVWVEGSSGDSNVVITTITGSSLPNPDPASAQSPEVPDYAQGTFSANGSHVIVVGGDVPVWPEIEVRGPGSGIKVSIGFRDIKWTGTLLANEYAQAFTDPNQRQFYWRDQNGAAYVDMRSQLGRMGPGATTIGFYANGAALETRCVVRYRRAYKGPF